MPAHGAVMHHVVVGVSARLMLQNAEEFKSWVPGTGVFQFSFGGQWDGLSPARLVLGPQHCSPWLTFFLIANEKKVSNPPDALLELQPCCDLSPYLP